MSETLTNDELKYVLALFNSYNKKGTFLLNELADVGTFTTKLTEHINKSVKEELKLSSNEYLYILNMIRLCTTRVPTVLGDMESIVFMSKKLEKIVSSEKEKLEKLEKVDEEIST